MSEWTPLQDSMGIEGIEPGSPLSWENLQEEDSLLSSLELFAKQGSLPRQDNMIGNALPSPYGSFSLASKSITKGGRRR